MNDQIIKKKTTPAFYHVLTRIKIIRYFLNFAFFLFLLWIYTDWRPEKSDEPGGSDFDVSVVWIRRSKHADRASSYPEKYWSSKIICLFYAWQRGQREVAFRDLVSGLQELHRCNIQGLNVGNNGHRRKDTLKIVRSQSLFLCRRELNICSIKGDKETRRLLWARNIIASMRKHFRSTTP